MINLKIDDNGYLYLIESLVTPVGNVERKYKLEVDDNGIRTREIVTIEADPGQIKLDIEGDE